MSDHAPRSKRKSGFSTSPLVLAIGLTLGYQLLTKLLPRLWATILPGGFEQGAMLSGPANLIWRLAWFCHDEFFLVLIGCGTIVAFSLALSRRPMLRPVVWLMAVGTICADAAILVIALRTSMQAVGIDQVLG